MNHLRKVLPYVILVALWSLVLYVFMSFNHIGPFKSNPTFEIVETADFELKVSIDDVIADIDKKLHINQQIKEQLVAQGYPEDDVEDLLALGAQKMTPIKNIASVEKIYGSPWNIKLYVGDYELAELDLVGNDEATTFILGLYQDKTEERVIFVHMSITAPVSVLQAGLSYKSEQNLDFCTAYLNDSDEIVGFKFDVELVSGKGVATYVATSSSVITQTDIEAFLGSVVDGILM